MNEYYLGLDMGTSSVGWAVTDKEYRIIRKKGKDLWGVREFDEAQTAIDRRTHRISRRRREREVARIGILKDYFADAIEKVDATFYQRLENSKYHIEDKEEAVRTKQGLFDDPEYKDKDYFGEYPTIFHLRRELIHNKEPHDVRLVYLALLNIFKHRGHFLNAGSSSEETVKMKEVYRRFVELLDDVLDIGFSEIDPQELENILSSRDLSRTVKAEMIIELLGLQKKQKQQIAFVKTICGLKSDARILFGLDDLNEKVEIQFSSFGYDEKAPEIQDAIGEEYFEIVTTMKMIYDLGSLAGILRGSDYLSEARVKDYEKHHEDLCVLKNVIKRCGTEEDYEKIFRSQENGSYSAYVNSVSDGRKKSRRNMKGRSRDEFYATIKKLVTKYQNINKDEKDIVYILNQIEQETFMPKQLTASNGIIPYQVHEKELKIILKNAQEYLTFLNDVDESGLSVSERIVKLFSFQIPYYIGPLNASSEQNNGNGWVVRKELGQVLPWNFDEKVDKKATAEKFISRMVRRCTYIHGEQVLPKNSLRYEKYCVLNEINNLRIDGERITPELKKDIYNELFKKGKKITRKQLNKYLLNRGIIENEEQVSGIDTSINSALNSYGKFKAVFGELIDTDHGKTMVEDIIFWCTIYGDSKEFLKEQIVEKYPQITKQQLKRILGMKFKDWGRFSKEFLQLEGCDKSTGEMLTISKALWETSYNLMELLYSDEFTFGEALEEKETKGLQSLSELTPELLNEYYFSAPVKKMIWQTVRIIKELEMIMGAAPSKIFIEMTRSDEEKGDKGRKDSRKKQLLELYKNVKDNSQNWKQLIEGSDASGKLRSKKMYLYLLQMGKDMYTGETIDLDDLFRDNLYDIDHIYPRHFVKDDSIHNNLVLVRKEANAHKSDTYPIESSIRNSEKVKDLWNMLRAKNLITEEKYRRLTGTKDFSEEQKADFIARQLVETGQATKGIADFLKQALPETQIVYSKAKNVSDFRAKYELYKSRAINDFHHANDAYLNIVVGNVYLTKFTNNPRNFIQKEYMRDPEKHRYHLYKMFDYDVIRGEDVAWIAPKKDGENGTIVTVKSMMQRHTPMITRQSFEGHGGFADQTLYSHKKVKEQGYIPLKMTDKRMADVAKYGGFSSVSTAYFFLVEHEIKGKKVRTLETLPIYMKEAVEQNSGALEQYCEETLGLHQFSIRLRKIKLQSLVKINGFYVLLSGKTGNQIILRNAVSLCLHQKMNNYIHKLEKIRDFSILDAEINKEDNMRLYEELVLKHSQNIYSKRPNPIGDKLIQGTKIFEKLDVKKQCELLLEILKLSELGAYTADLSNIGGAKMSGKMLTSKEVTKAKEFRLINTSVTGLITGKEVDLLTV